jgi:hypothetical protein
MTKQTLIKSYAYFKGELQRAYENTNEKLINYYTDEIQKLLTKYHTKKQGEHTTPKNFD